MSSSLSMVEGRFCCFIHGEVSSLKKCFLLLVCVLVCSGGYGSPVCDVHSYGAKGDGATSDTAAVSAAIDACVKQGGGTIYFGPGRYVIGTVQLYSHIHLYLESGAALVGSHDIHDYLASPPFGFARHYGVDITGEGTVLGMLIAKNADDISIDGQGEIDGQGDSFVGHARSRMAVRTTCRSTSATPRPFRRR